MLLIDLAKKRHGVRLQTGRILLHTRIDDVLRADGELLQLSIFVLEHLEGVPDGPSRVFADMIVVGSICKLGFLVSILIHHAVLLRWREVPRERHVIPVVVIMNSVDDVVHRIGHDAAVLGPSAGWADCLIWDPFVHVVREVVNC